ncbi:MAG: iron ABC transporter permease [Pseudomonadales bacterium]|nr:iron ABC transporter permease [Pseudomonadales bacterium]
MRNSHIDINRYLLVGSLLVMLVVAIVIDLGVGPVTVDIFDALVNILNKDISQAEIIFFEIRLPRALLAGMVGFTLGLSGAALQGLLKNPLAGPGLIGVSSCAALGAIIMIYYGLATVHWVFLPAGGMIGAMLSVVFIFFLAGRNSSMTSLILAGIAINAAASSATALALNFADSPYAMSEMVFWLLGSVSNRSLTDLGISLPFMVVGAALILMSSRFLDALSLGEDTAQSMGFSLGKYRTLLIVGVALSVGAAVSVSGNIGFVGLVVPHMLRPFVGHEPGRLLLVSGLAGGVLLVMADIFVQTLSSTQDLKLGVVTALVGGPFFLLLVYRSRNDFS